MAISEFSKYGFDLPQRLVDFQPVTLTKVRHRELSKFADDAGLKIYQAADMLIQIGLSNFDMASIKRNETEKEIYELKLRLKELEG